MTDDEQTRLNFFMKRLNQTGISEKNRHYIKSFLKESALRQLSIARQKILVMELLYWDGLVKKDFKQAKQGDIKSAVAKMQAAKYTELTKKKKLSVLKMFYRWLLGKGEQYPEQISWARQIRFKEKELDSTTIIRKDDLAAMLKACDNARDSALLYFLWESGLRAGELLKMKINDLRDEGNFYSAEVSGKTGRRKIVFVECMPYLKKWLNKHPQRTNSDAPLFCSLFRNKVTTLSHRHLNTLLKKAGKMAKITKPVNPHAFRKAAASDKAPRYSHAVICSYFGWKQGSRTPQRYLGIDNEQSNTEVLKAYGIGKNKPIEPVEMVKCPNCGAENRPGNLICDACSRALSTVKAASLMEEMEKMKKKIDKLENERAVRTTKK